MGFLRVPFLLGALALCACSAVAADPSPNASPTPAAVAAGTSRQVTGTTKEEATQNVATVAEVHTLVVAPKDSSTLRASFLLFDDRMHTDVAPKHELYLTMHNFSEMAEASSAHHIAGINELISSRRVEAGLYEAVVRVYDLDHKYPGEGPEKVVKLTIDARAASADVRAMKGAGEFEAVHLTTPITVTETFVRER